MTQAASLASVGSSALSWGGAPAAAWVRFSSLSGVITIASSFNVSSITYSSVGNFIVNFATAMSNSNYALVGTAYYPGVTAGVIGIVTPATTTCAIQTVNSTTAAATNFNYICAVFFST